MNFDEIKILWDSQKEEPMYAIDKEGMHQSIRTEGKSIQHILNIFEIMSMLILFVLGIVIGLEPVLEGHDSHQFIDAAIYISIGTFLGLELRRRKKQEKTFSQSILGDLDRAVFHLDVQIRRYALFPWVVMGPMMILMLIKLPMYYDSKPLWLWPMCFLSIVVSVVALKHELKTSLLPKRESLLKLRDKLDQPHMEN